MKLETEGNQETLSLVGHGWSGRRKEGGRNQPEWSCPVELVYRRFIPSSCFHFHYLHSAFILHNFHSPVELVYKRFIRTSCFHFLHIIIFHNFFCPVELVFGRYIPSPCFHFLYPSFINSFIQWNLFAGGLSPHLLFLAVQNSSKLKCLWSLGLSVLYH